MSPSGIDESWGYADPAEARRAGVQVVSGYLSNDPSKNWNAGKVKAYHAAGIAVLLNWEAQAGAPLNGAGQGRADATEAVRQARALFAAVGSRPGNRPVIYFSCDRDINSGQFPVIDAYYLAAAGVCHAAGFGVGCYGEADLVHHLAVAGITDAEWQTLAWSGGRVDPAADFYQSSINNTVGGASVDFDEVIHPSQLGAWWPATSPYNQPGDDMSAADVAAINKHNDQNTAKIVAAVAAARAETDRTAVGIAKAITTAIHGDATHPDSLASIHADLDKLIGKGGA